MRFLVTGGAGFIGSHTVEKLVAEGHAVTVLDNLSSGSRNNLQFPAPDLRFIEGDIRDRKACVAAMEGVEAVIHLAAEISVVRSFQAPEQTHQINIDGTLNLLEAARLVKAKAFVFASSCAVYGDARAFPIDESTILSPLSPYAVSKMTGESYCRMYREVHGLNTCVFRFFNIYGSRQEDSSPYASVIALFTRRLLAARPVEIFGDGLQTRDFLSVTNVADALCLAARHADKLTDPAYNLASGKQTSVLDLFHLLSRLTGKTVPYEHAPARPGEIRHSLGSSALFRRRAVALGKLYSPAVLETALADTVRWYASKETQ